MQRFNVTANIHATHSQEMITVKRLLDPEDEPFYLIKFNNAGCVFLGRDHAKACELLERLHRELIALEDG